MMWGRKREIRELHAELREARERAKAAAQREANARIDQMRRDHVTQCERLANDVLKAKREAAEARAGARRVADQNRVLGERLDDLRDGSGLAALDSDYERLDQVHQRAKRRIVRYVTELRQLRLRTATLQKQLDSALGLDTDPRIAEGAGWQARRPDKGRAA
jgi:chromosome segregation ATPase